MTAIKLISFDLCPFVQRSVITLEEKGVPYEINYIDLAAKPAWFLALSPFGKVPVLQVESTVLFESAVINEYLDETTPPPRLHPADPLRRAHNRAWIEFGSALLVDGWQMQVATDEESTRKHAAAVRTKLGRLEAELRAPGPFFNGAEFSLVDAALAPALQRLTWSVEIAPSLALFEGLDGIARWTQALLARPSVQASTVPDIRARFVAYLQGGGSPTRQVAGSWLGAQAAR